MRKTVIASLCLVTFGFVGLASAQQPPPGRKPGIGATVRGMVQQKKDPAQPATTPPPATTTPAPAPAAPDNSAMCSRKRSINDQEKRRLDSMKAELAGTDSEIVALRARIDELTRRRDNMRGSVRALENKVERDEKQLQKECTKDETCERYEHSSVELDARSAQIETELANVRNEIGQNAGQVTDLRRRIEPLQKEYSEKRCNNLVPGETEQSTIDRCAAIFSDWNRLQGDLNRLNNRTPDLKNRYEALLSELRNIESRGQAIDGYIASRCQGSKQVGAQKNVTRRREGAQSVGQELDRLIEDIRTLRGMQITVTVK